MIPKYTLPAIDIELLQQCVQRSLEKVSHAILDWKSIPSEHKTTILTLFDEIDIHYVKT
jgi:D-tyrosyl-tRNA(Tyr) deacylase